MPPTQHTDGTKANGHGVSLAEDDTLKLGPPEWSKRSTRGLLERLMSARPMRAAAGEVDTTRRPTLVTVMMFAGLFMWLATMTINSATRTGTVNEKLATLEATQKKLMDERDENIKLRERVESLVRQRTELSQYVGELSMWSADVRTKLISTGRGRSIDVPPLPQRNGRGLGE